MSQESSKELHEGLALSVAVSLRITQDEALDLGVLGKKLAERNITFVIEGPFAGQNTLSGISFRVRVFVFYQFGSKVKDLEGNNFGGNDPLKMVLTGTEWLLESLRDKSVEDLAAENASLWHKVMHWTKSSIHNLWQS